MHNISFEIIILAGFLCSVGAQAAGLRLGRAFCSKERKVGTYRAGGGQGVSSKLPMTGGPVLMLCLLALGGIVAWRFWTRFPWEAAATVALFGMVGFVDDFGKYKGTGLSPRVKTIGCLAVSAVVAGFLSRFPVDHALSTGLRWAVETAFLFCISVAADFSDGIDGQAGGLGFLVCLAMGAAGLFANRLGGSLWAVGAVSIAAFLVFNLPSAWTSRGGGVRRARVYLGDSGALAMGGGLAATALWLHMGWVFVPAAAIWMLEGFSSMWQAEFLVKRVYRKFGVVERYGREYAPHMEFPLPLLAAPVHHHFEVAGWNRMQVWKLMMASGILCGLGAMLSARYGVWMAAGYAVSTGVCVALWSLAGLYRTFYLAVGPGGFLVLNSGLPVRLAGRRFSKTVRKTGLTAEALTVEQRLWLYRPLPRPDALEVLVRILAGAGSTVEAMEVSATLPPAFREMRLADVELGGASR